MCHPVLSFDILSSLVNFFGNVPNLNWQKERYALVRGKLEYPIHLSAPIHDQFGFSVGQLCQLNTVLENLIT